MTWGLHEIPVMKVCELRSRGGERVPLYRSSWVIDASFFDSSFDFFTTTISIAPGHFRTEWKKTIAADLLDEMFADVPFAYVRTLLKIWIEIVRTPKFEVWSLKLSLNVWTDLLGTILHSCGISWSCSPMLAGSNLDVLEQNICSHDDSVNVAITKVRALGQLLERK